MKDILLGLLYAIAGSIAALYLAALLLVAIGSGVGGFFGAMGWAFCRLSGWCS